VTLVSAALHKKAEAERKLHYESHQCIGAVTHTSVCFNSI